MSVLPVDASCSWQGQMAGFCSNDGETIGIGFQETSPGLGGGGGAENDFWEYGTGGGGESWGDSGYVPDPAVVRGDAQRCAILGPAGPGCTPTPSDPGDEAGGPSPEEPVQAITISDVAQFTPTPPEVSVDPAGVAVMNLPANFVSDATEQTLEAEILGRWVSVRFTPITFDFDTGDGTVVTASHGGVSWEVSGSPQFTPTDTSHVYRERGVVYPAVTVTYEASVDLGAGWIPLGTVAATGPTRELQVYEAVTRLIKADA